MKLRRPFLLLLILVFLFTTATAFAKGAKIVIKTEGGAPESFAWGDLAGVYQAETGTQVEVISYVGMTAKEALSSRHGTGTLILFYDSEEAGVDKQLMELTDEELLAELNSPDDVIRNSKGKIKGVGMWYQPFGIAVNIDLLKKAGYEIKDITNYESLKKIADDIHSRKQALRFDAFAPFNADSATNPLFKLIIDELAIQTLAYEAREDQWDQAPKTVKGSFLNCFKNLWDLMLTDSQGPEGATTEETRNIFIQEKAVFYPCISWEWILFNTNMVISKLDMIPAYFGALGEENVGLNYRMGCYMGVNAKSSKADKKATVEFLKWLVTNDAGTSFLAEYFGQIPYKAAKKAENTFSLKTKKMLDEGKESLPAIVRQIRIADEWYDGIAAALHQYTKKEAGWEAVENAFINGWKLKK